MLVAEGDSFTVGFGAPAGLSYPNQLMQYFPDRLHVVNAGTNGAVLVPDMQNEAVTQIDSQFTAGAVLAMFGGGNDIAINGATGADTYTAYAAYCTARRAAGFKVIAFSLLPRTNEIATPSKLTERKAFSALVRANWRTFADGFVDIEADSRIGYDTAYNDTTYFNPDGHPTQAGYAVIAELVKPALAPLLQ